jgi:predicted sugar kinase
MAALSEASVHLSADSGRLIQHDLAQALAQKDIAAFGWVLMQLQEMNREALAAVNCAPEISESQENLFALMQENGALAWGQTLAGFGHYALVHGGPASRVLRKKITDHVGYSGGIVMATITANHGSQAVLVHQDGRKSRLDL